jgi:hypothetical protein
MRDLILAVAAVVMAGSYTALICWLVIEKRKVRQEREDLAQAIRARGLLNLSDKPYMIPKQHQDQEIEVIQGKREPLVLPCGWEY